MSKQLTECKVCRNVIARKAAFCPHCGDDKKEKGMSGCLIFILLIAGIYMIGSMLPDNKVTTLDYERDKAIAEGRSSSSYGDTSGAAFMISACNAAQEAVKVKLKSPASAKFSRCGEYEIRSDASRNKVSVEGRVDSQNSFGAMLRSEWIVILERTGGSDQWPVWTPTRVAVAAE